MRYTLGASLLENLLTGKGLKAKILGKGVIRADDWTIRAGEGTIRAVVGTIMAGQDFWCCFIL